MQKIRENIETHELIDDLKDSTRHLGGVDSVYSYNFPGIGGLSAEAYEKLGITSGNIANANIANIYAKEIVEATLGLGTMVGDTQGLSIDYVGSLSNHKIGELTKSLHLYNMRST